MKIELKRQFCFELAEAIGWNAYNDPDRIKTVYATNGTATIYMSFEQYAIPEHQIEISGSWPKSGSKSSPLSGFYPTGAFSIKCSAKRKVSTVAKDVKKRFLNWFVVAHAEMVEKRVVLQIILLLDTL
jgi:hypothetical protein